MSDGSSTPALLTDTREQASTDGSMVSARGALMSLSMALVGVLGYGFTVVLTHLLEPRAYAHYAAAQMLVGTVGAFAGAMIPMPTAHVVRTNPPGSEGRRQGMAFAWAVCAASAVTAAIVTGAITAAFAPATVVAAVAVSSATLFVISPVFGWMVGELRFLRYGLAIVLEVVARVGFGVGVVLLGLGAGGAITGFTVGVAVVLLMVPRALRRDLAWRPRVIREKARWAEAGDIAVTQLVVGCIVGAEVVVMALLHAPPTQSAGYQALSTLAKGPAYVAAGAAVVAFPLLRGAGAPVHSILATTLRSFSLLAFSTAAVVATVPHELVLLVIPERYAGSLHLLPILAAAGVGYAALTMFATLMVALRAYRRCQAGLLVAVVLLPLGLALGWRLGAAFGLAIGVAAATLVAAAVLWIAAFPLLPPGTLRRALRGAPVLAAVAALLAVTSPLPVLWVVLVALLGAAVLLLSRQRKPTGTT